MKLALSALGFLTLAVAVSADLAALNLLISQCNAQQRQTLGTRQEGCTQSNVAVRKEWCEWSQLSLTIFGLANCYRGNMSKNERLAYTDAVLCLQSKPSISPPGLVPGARSRFDDFQAVHINQTYSVHFNVNDSSELYFLTHADFPQARLLPWHRLFTWVFEQALRNECGYK